jgi:shikimate kinase
MGAGKSTIGPILANTLGWDFHDLDKVIEMKVGKKISEIFKIYGEEYFRKLECEVLNNLSHTENAIISLGGGTITSKNNFDLIKKTGKVIYLKASLDSVFKRLHYKKDRPILNIDETAENPEEKLFQRLQLLMNQRKNLYEQADFIIDTDEVSVGKTVDFIAKLVLKDQKNL